MYVNVETTQVVSLSDIRRLHPNASIPMGRPDLSSLGYELLHDGVKPTPSSIQYVQDAGVQFDGQKWVKTYTVVTRALAARRADIKAQIEVIRDSKVQSFAFEHNGQTYHLQCRDESDKSNWLTVDMTASRLIAAGQSTTTIGIRTEENIVLHLTAADVSALMLALAQNVSAIFSRSWELKDAVDASEAPESVDIHAGW